MNDEPRDHPNSTAATQAPHRRSLRATASHFLAGALIGLMLATIAALYVSGSSDVLTLSTVEKVAAIALVFGVVSAIFGESLVGSKPLRGLAKFLDSFPTVY